MAKPALAVVAGTDRAVSDIKGHQPYHTSDDVWIFLVHGKVVAVRKDKDIAMSLAGTNPANVHMSMNDVPGLEGVEFAFESHALAVVDHHDGVKILEVTPISEEFYIAWRLASAKKRGHLRALRSRETASRKP